MFDFVALLPQCAAQVHPQTMRLVVQHESRGNPFAIGLNSKDGARLSWQPRNKEEAVATAKALQTAGYNFDAGLGQLNSVNIKKLGLTFDQVFEPCTNLKYSAGILHGNYQRAIKQYPDNHNALLAALSAYNTGNFQAGFKNGYVKKVLAQAGKTVSPIPIVAAKPTKKAPSSQPVAIVVKTAPVAAVIAPQTKETAIPSKYDGFGALASENRFDGFASTSGEVAP